MDRLSDLDGAYLRLAGQIGDGARDLQDPRVRARTQAEVAIARPSDLFPVAASQFTQAARDREAAGAAREPSSRMLAALSDWIAALLQSLKRCADLILSWLESRS